MEGWMVESRKWSFMSPCMYREGGPLAGLYFFHQFVLLVLQLKVFLLEPFNLFHYLSQMILLCTLFVLILTDINCTKPCN